MNEDQEIGSQFLINFLGQYTALMEKQLQGVRQTMLDTVADVMEGVSKISEATESQRIHAEKTLEKTYLNPDKDTQLMVDGLQDMVNLLFDEAKVDHEKGGDQTALSFQEPEDVLQNRITRFDEKFMADMGNLGELDDKLKNMLFGIMGALSSEDVIAQRMEHVIMALKALQTGLNYVLLDYSTHSKIDELRKVTSDIKRYTYRQYTIEDEKDEFFEIFPEDKDAS